MRLTFLGLVALTALLHGYIAWFEIFAWTSRGPLVFDTFPAELFPQTTQLAANQGVYNAFLAAGLIWSLFIQDRVWQRRIATCFLLFVLVAGIAAAITVSVRPGMFQIVPSSMALVFMALDFLSGRKSNPKSL
jgi:putative membrane protein